MNGREGSAGEPGAGARAEPETVLLVLRAHDDLDVYSFENFNKRLDPDDRPIHAYATSFFSGRTTGAFIGSS